MQQDWVGNKNSIFKTLGSSHHTADEREPNDYYATDPIAIDLLLNEEQFSNVWEPACGEGHLSKRLIHHRVESKSSDLINRGYGEVIDFLDYKGTWDGDIITNPPYRFSKEFIEKAISIVPDGRKVAMFLKVQFMEGKARKILFKNYPPETIYVSSSRINCAKNGDFEGLRTSGGSAVAYAWYVWKKGYQGATTVKWIN